MSKLLERECIICKKIFKRYKSDIDLYGGKYCSQKCAFSSPERSRKLSLAFLGKKGHPAWNKGNYTAPDIYKLRYHWYKENAKRSGLVFEITLDLFKKIISQDCYYCNDKGFGIDRVDSSKGYIEGNMVSCCKICNQMKSDRNVIDFIQKCKDITNKNLLTSAIP